MSTIGRHHSPASAPATDSVSVVGGESDHVHVHVHGDAHVALLDAQKLDCYRLAIEFQPVVARLTTNAGHNIRDQFERAALSIALNTAEGAGRRSKGERRRFYQIARGSAAECGALLDVLLARGLASGAEVRDARHFVVRLVQMLSKLEERPR